MPRKNNKTKLRVAKFDFRSSCQSKKRYSSKLEAERTAEKTELASGDWDLKLSVYHCELCGGWHLTKK